MPEGLRLLIRINADKDVIKHLDKFLEDLDARGIWPQQARRVKLYLSLKELYPGINVNDKSVFLNKEEFYEAKEKFREMKLEYYNNWARRNNKRLAKRPFLYPKLPPVTCETVSSPYGLVIDHEGYIHKCWIDVNNEETRIQHISERFDITLPQYKKWLEFDKFSYNERCNNCKYYPVCYVCPWKLLNANHPNNVCYEWKGTLETLLKKQYIMSIETPDKICAFKRVSKVIKESESETRE